MEVLKQAAQRKTIILGMTAQCFLMVWGIISTFNNYVKYDYLPLSYWDMFLSVIRIVAMVLIIQCLKKDKKDKSLLIGVGIMVITQLITVFTVVNYYTVLYLIAWIGIGLLTFMVVMPNEKTALEKYRKYSNKIGFAAVIIMIGTNIMNILFTLFNIIGYADAVAIFTFLVSNVIGILLTMVSFGLFAVYMGMLAQSDEESEKLNNEI